MGNSAWPRPDTSEDQDDEGGLCGCISVVVAVAVLVGVWLALWCCSGPG